MHGLDAKHEGRARLRKFCLFGERCSGTNYLQQLITANFPQLGYQKAYGWKHFPAWLSAPAGLNPGPSKFYTFENSDAYLFFVIFRNPYDWLRSLWEHPHHAASHLHHIPFDTFIHSTWICDPLDEFIHAMDKNPHTGAYFSNILQLRSAKIRNMLMIKNKVKNIYYINYETLLNQPEQVVHEIARIFNLRTNYYFVPILNYCDPPHDKHSLFLERDAFIPPAESLLFIQSQLDPSLESSIGYDILKGANLETFKDSLFADPD
jgi:hypothetical protein